MGEGKIVNISQSRLKEYFKTNFGSREEDKVAGFFVFSHIRMRVYLVRLGKG